MDAAGRHPRGGLPSTLVGNVTLMKLSVIICTHNPSEHYLRRVLESLRTQTLPAECWELILVDNRSKEPVADRFDLSWHRQAACVVEPALGLTRARLKGAEVARGELICYLDDDTVLQNDYLERAVAIGDEWPRLGAWGGQLLPEYEPGFEPSPRARLVWDISLQRDLWSNLHERFTCPIGGGMVLRRAVIDHYRKELADDPRRLELDRKGDSLVSSGDIDLAFCACDIGLGIGRFQSLVITHLIPRSRCEEAYLDRLAYGIGYSSTLLDYIRNRKTHLSLARRMILLARLLQGKDPRARCQFHRGRGIRKAIDTIASLPGGR